MKRLRRLRSRLAALAGRRLWNERGRAASLLLVGVVCVLVSVFLVDWFFDLPVAQRLVAITAAAAVLFRIVFQLGRYFGQPRDSVMQTALSLHLPDHGDMVAALEFDAEQQATSGSEELKQAVVENVEQNPVNIFAGFSWSRFGSAAGRLLVVGGLTGAAIYFFPIYAVVFIDRLALGDRLYPRSTEVVSVVVNQQSILQREPGDEATPDLAHCPQGKPVSFFVETVGRPAQFGSLELTSRKSGAMRQVELQLVTPQDRKAALLQARTQLTSAFESSILKTEAVRSAIGLAPIDLATLASQSALDDLSPTDAIAEAIQHIDASIERLDKDLSNAVWRCELPRLVEPAAYQIKIGDGRTSTGLLDVAEIPIVDLKMTVDPPNYAAGIVTTPIAIARQIAVLEGSRVDVQVQSLTERPLARVWVRVWSGDNESATTIELAASDSDKLTWRVPGDSGTPFQSVSEPIRYEAMAEDANGFAIENPLRGSIRVKRDRPPSATVKVVHRVVLPSAKPQVQYRVNDDFGIQRMRLVAQIETETDDAPIAEPGVSADTEAAPPMEIEENKRQFSILDEALGKSDLPVAGEYSLDLSQLGLQKGDRLRVTLEAQDDRGDAEGRWTSSEPVFLEVSDESGVLSAILESDERSEQRLDDLIRRQLGIGDEP